MDEKNEIQIGEINESLDEKGEFVPSYFAWVSLEGQRKRVEELQNMTKKRDKKSKS